MTRPISGKGCSVFGQSLQGQAVEDLIYRDDLTGVYNRRAFSAFLQEEVRKAAEAGHPLSLAVVDLDYFKQINDTHGHQDGDAVLTGFGELIRSVCGEAATPFRYGGDEFTVVMPGVERADAMRWMAYLQECLQARPIRLRNGQAHPLTLSIGVASWPEDVQDPHALFDAADQAVYLAKRGGRNQVRHPEPVGLLFDETTFHRLFPCPRLVGRSDLLAVLRPLLAPSVSGWRPMVVMEGRAGAGKSRMLHECWTMLGTEHYRVLTAVGQVPMVAQPCGMLIEAVLPVLEATPGLLSRLPADEEQVIRTLLPGRGASRSGRVLSPAHRRKALVLGMVRLLRTLAKEKPLAILLDDLQWIDTLSLDVIAEFKETPEGRVALIVAALRKEPGDESKAVVDFLVSAVKAHRAMMVEVAPLNYHMVGEMIGAIVPGAETHTALVDLVIQKSRALPLLVEEVLKYLIQTGIVRQGAAGVEVGDLQAEDVPDEVFEIIARRSQTLEADVQSSISRAAVIGDRFEMDVLQALEGRNVGQFLDAIDKGIRAAMIRSDQGDQFHFTAHGVQQAMYQRVPSEERTVLHEKLAVIEQERRGTQSDAVLGTVAWHHAMAGNSQEASRVLSRLTAYEQPQGVVFDPVVPAPPRRVTARVMAASAEPDVLLADLESGHEEKMAAAVEGLIALGQNAMKLLLRFVMRTDDLRARRLALTCLDQIEVPYLPVLAEELHRTQDYREKCRLIGCLAEVREPRTLDVLKPFVCFPDAQVRREALAAFERMGTDQACEIVLQALRDRDAGVRQDVAASLGRLGRGRAVPDLIGLIRKRSIFFFDPHQEVQREACMALGRLRDPVSIPPLVQAVRYSPWWTLQRSKAPETRAAAAMALASFSGPNVERALMAATRDPHLTVRSAAKLALNKLMGTPFFADEDQV